MSRKVVQEKDIHQARWECKWKTLPEMVDTWSTKATESADQLEFFKCFMLGETLLETYLLQKEEEGLREEKEKIDEDERLQKAHGYLMKAINISKQFKEEQQKPNILQLHLLLVKYHFIANNPDNVLKCMKDVNLNTDIAVKLPKRGCLLASEALLYKGKALETSQTDPELEESKIIAAYEMSAEVSLWLFTEGSKTLGARKSAEPVIDRPMPSALFAAFTRPAEIELQNGRVNDAVDHYRSLLRAVETKGTAGLRKVLALKLAEILLFGISEDEYVKPPVQTWSSEDRLKLSNVLIETYQTRSLSTSSSKSSSKSLHKDYSRSQSYGKDGSFCPQDEFEEALLLLLISESLLLQDACVSLFEEDKKRRKQTIDEATAIYDMLSIVLTRRKQYALLLECIERGIKLAYRQFNLWFKYGLALICNAKYERALVVMKKCLELEPDNVEVFLYCAKICINHLRDYEEALQFAEQAKEVADENSTKASCYLLIGLCNSVLACKAINHSEELSLRKKAIQALEKARDLDPRDVDILCQLALDHALAKEMNRAATVVHQALKLDICHRNSILLLALILSAQKKVLEALEVVDAAILDYPEDFILFEVKIQLTEQYYGGEQALEICHDVFRIWNTLYAEEITDLNPFQHEVDNKSAVGSMKKSLSESKLSEAGRSFMRLTLVDGKDGNDDDEVSSISASVTLERNLFEAASSARSGMRLKTPAAIALLAKIWLITADVYLNMGNTEEASKCILEASSVFPVSPDVLYKRGKLNHIRENIEEAKACYECVLAVDPHHIDAMENIAAIHHESGSHVMAEKFLRDALIIKPASPFIWQALGLVLQSRGFHEEAIDCFFTALDLEATHPIRPFTLVPRLFKEDSS